MNRVLLKNATALLSELVACPSVNPQERKIFAAPFGEGQLTQLLRTRLENWGATVTIDEVAPGRPNLIAHWQGKDRSRSLMLEAHADTVPVDGMTIAPFNPKVENGKLYGRGACDTKGAMAAMLLAIQEVLDRHHQPPTDLFFVTTCNEENGATGARALIESGLRPDAAIVGEPTELAIAWTHRGSLRWQLTTIGKAAHSSAPEAGVNAIYHMARVIEHLRGPMSKRLKETLHDVLGHPTLSVGAIHGGSQVNIVPDECTIDIDRRILPSETNGELISELEREMATLAEQIEEFRFSVEETQYYPPLECDLECDVIRRLQVACETKLGAAKLAAVPFASDAGVFDEAGIPSLVFGPGSIREAHKADEYIELEQVARAVGVYAQVIEDFGDTS